MTFGLSDVLSAAFLSSLRLFRAERTDFAILPHNVSTSSPLGMLPMAFVMADGIMNGAARYATMSLAQLLPTFLSSMFFFFASCDPLELPYTYGAYVDREGNKCSLSPISPY